jgi:class 3 adenylate cyclase
MAAPTPKVGLFERLLRASGLAFDDPAEEDRFANGFSRASPLANQIFLALGALSFVSFFVWDTIIDPQHDYIGLWIRAGFTTPLMLMCSALLFWQRMHRHVETIILVAITVIQFSQAWIYTVMAHGFDYAVMGFCLIFLALSSAVNLRIRHLGIGALISLVMMIGGHLYAQNARPNWLFVNLMAMGSATVFGLVSGYFREITAREQYLTQRDLEQSQERARELLNSILPNDMVRRLQLGETAIADTFEEVTVVFADLVGFTSLSRRLSPPDLIWLLNDIFSRFDRIAERYNMEKIKTIGDAYLAVGGMSQDRREGHVLNAARFALSIRDALSHQIAESDLPIDIRIGLHVGPMIAGVIGTRQPSFDCWGDAVSVGSGLEASAPPGQILISEQAFDILGDQIRTEKAADIFIKGKGQIPAYRLLRIANNFGGETITKLA